MIRTTTITLPRLVGVGQSAAMLRARRVDLSVFLAIEVVAAFVHCAGFNAVVVVVQAPSA